MRIEKREFVVWNRSLPDFIRQSLVRRYGDGPFHVTCTIKQKKGQEPRRKHRGLKRSRLWLKINLPSELKYTHLRTWFPSTMFSFMINGHRKQNHV